MESQQSNLGLSPGSQPVNGENPTPAPTSNWKIWSRGINKRGDWYCTHRFEDGTQAYHYVNEDGTVYMKHRDGSATLSPAEGVYTPREGPDPDSKIPAPTMEEIIEEAKEVKREHREYLASPVRYWNGVRTFPRRRSNNIAWLFPICDCADHYDDDYPDYSYGDDYGDDYEYDYEEYGAYGINFGDEEDEEGDSTDESSQSADESKPMITQEGDKTAICITDLAHLPSAGTQAHLKHEIKEEPRGGSSLAHPTILKPEPEVIPGAGFVSEPTASESAEPVVPRSIIGEKTSHSSGVGPDVQTEGKRILRSHRSKPY